MKEISTVTNGYYTNKYLPMIKLLGEHLCRAYGRGFPMNYIISDEPLDKMYLQKLTGRIASFLVRPLCKIFKYPQYYSYLSNVLLSDLIFSKKVAYDKSKILFTSSLMYKTVEQAKKHGKTIVLEAGNSEPEREHRRIIEEYEKFNIKHKYIYGDPIFKNINLKSFELADYIVTISKVSENTYIEAGFDKNKMHLIPLTGTDFPIQKIEFNSEKPKAFISTAFHNFIKGTHRLLNAWEKANINDIPLIVVGRLCEDMREFVENFGPFDNVQFVGHRNDLKDYYKQFDAVGVLMSLSEGAGRTTPEQMSFGFPMIVSPDATCDLVKDGYNGFIVESTDEDGLAERLRYFAEDWSRVDELKENVIASVNHRTMQDWSIELGNYLLSLI